MKPFWMAIIMFSNSTLHAGNPRYRAPEFEVSAKPKGAALEIIATAPTQHHFNLKAPISLQSKRVSHTIKPLKASDHEIIFKITTPETEDYQITLYLCDDANTFCEKHLLVARWNKLTSKLTVRANENDALHLDPPIKSRIQINDPGFNINIPTDALRQAKESKKPLLIDFYGIWCPPCNKLDEEVFSSIEFKNQSSRFVKLKLDADSPISWTLKAKYKIGSYPTVIFATAEGEEIHRIVGFRNKKFFLEQMEGAWSSREQSFSQWMSDAKDGDRRALDHLGRVHLERKEYSQAITMLEKSTLYREHYFDALISHLESSQKPVAAKQNLIATLETSIKEFPNTPRSIARRMKLASLYAQEKEIGLQKRQLNELILVAQQLIIQPASKLESYDISRADLWTMIAEAYENLGDFKRAPHFWQQAVLEYQHKIKSGQERGLHLEMAYCLWKSGDFSSAEKIYLRFQNQYPEEFTFYFNHASMKMTQKRFIEAEQIAQKAFQHSYGDNRLRTTYLLAQAMKSNGNKTQAKQLLEQILQTTKPPEDQSIRTHLYLQQLRDFNQEISIE